jgi:Rod binding domain-containing protein
MSDIRSPKNFIPIDTVSKIALSNEKNADKVGAHDKSSENQKVREVADMYEKFFIKELTRHMKSSLAEDGLIKKNNAEKIFSEQLDEQYSEQWNKRGGFGLSDIIYENVTERYKDQLPADGSGTNGGVKMIDSGKIKIASGIDVKKPEDFSHEQMLWQIDNLNKIK